MPNVAHQQLISPKLVSAIIPNVRSLLQYLPRTLRTSLLMLPMLSIVVGCGGGGGGGSSTPPPPTTYTIGGTVSGLTGTGLILQDNGGSNVAVSTNGAFTFSNSVASGATYSVTVSTQPIGQTCSVTNGSGTASANVTNVQVTCSTTTYTIGGTVSGLNGTGLVLQDNGGNNLAVSASGSFTFSTAVASGSTYSVTVLTQPTGQTCSVTNGTGTASAIVTNVQVACSNPPPTTYTIGGTVSGLNGTGLILQDNGGNNLAVSASGSFTFSAAVANGAAYSVTVLTQPTSQSCTVTNGSGTATANVTNVLVACTNNTYTIGGIVSGLSGTGLVLQNNGGNNLAVSANGGFTFSTTVASGAAYNVTVLTQPIGQSCTVTNGNGTASANVANVLVACSNNTYMIGGTVSGLTGTGLVLQVIYGNYLSTTTVSANGSFTFSTAVASGAAYTVTVLTQPTGQSCTVSNGSGTASANVTNVQVTCTTTTYTIGGTVSGLTGTGLVLQDNGGNNLTVSANGSFTFSTAIASGAAYTVTVLTQPTGQSCTVTNGSSAASANVTNVQVACTAIIYTIGGTISGLTASGLLLAEGSQTVSVASGATSFTFPTAIASGSSYAVTVKTQPGGETCSVTNGGGTASANVTNVQVTCSNVYYTIGGIVSGLIGTGLVLQDNGVNNLAVSVNGSFTFSTAVASGGAYSVTVLTQPTGQNCAVTNGSGTASAIVTNVQVTCGGTWIWIGGGTTAGQSGVYGTLGTAASTNIPGARRRGVTWSDASGNLWLLGGYGFDSTGTYGFLNDLWEFDPDLGTSGEWTWMGGSNQVGNFGGQPGDYGILGTAGGIPGGRLSAVSWSDASGNLWLFGGYGFDSTGMQSSTATSGWLNDLWKFDPKLGTYGEWTWMGGSSVANQSAVYGTLGTAYSTNIPGARSGAVSWSDASGNLWLFGGYGYDSAGTYGYLNDLWKFDSKLGTYGEWTWMGGSNTVGISGGGQSGVYGTLGTAASTNIPGGREQHAVSWIDASGNLWLFGGYGYDSTGTVGYLNDLWEFNPSLGTYGEWTWMGGGNTVGVSGGGQSGVYGTLGTPASTNIPGARDSAVSWIDASGNLWLFGGYGIDSTGAVGDLNDLWKFDSKLGTNGEWTWMGGSSTANQSAVYGPGGRSGAVSWSDASGNLWLFGGSSNDLPREEGDFNDLWEYQP